MNKKIITSAAAASVLAGALSLAATHTLAAEDDMEKCYGVVKAGHNDCQANGHSCQGQASMDGDGQEWVLVPAGLCEKLAGGTTKPM